MADLTNSVDDMLAAYAMYINNSACRDADKYWREFLKAMTACQESRDQPLTPE